MIFRILAFFNSRILFFFPVNSTYSYATGSSSSYYNSSYSKSKKWNTQFKWYHNLLMLVSMLGASWGLIIWAEEVDKKQALGVENLLGEVSFLFFALFFIFYYQLI